MQRTTTMDTTYIKTMLERVLEKEGENLSDKSARIARELGLVIQRSDIWTEYRPFENLQAAYPRDMTFSEFFAAVIALAIRHGLRQTDPRQDYERSKRFVQSKWAFIRRNYKDQISVEQQDFFIHFGKHCTP